MIGKLKKFSVRERYNQQVARVVVDVPVTRLKGRDIGEDEMLEYLTNNTGTEIGFDISALEDTEQEAVSGEDIAVEDVDI